MTYQYKFFYVDTTNRVSSLIIEIDDLDSELAIATFEQLYPNTHWLYFIATKKTNDLTII